MSTTLIVSQILPNGFKKSWKLKSKGGVQTFGTSRLADLISQDSNSQGIEGAFEFRKNNWYYLNLNLESKQNTETLLTSQVKLQLNNSVLEFQVSEKKEDIAQQLEKKNSENQSNYDLYIVRLHNKVVETKIVKSNKKFKTLLPESEHLKITKKPLSLESAAHLTRTSPKQMLDKESQKSVGIILASCFALTLLALLTPKSHNIEMTTTSQVPAQAVTFKMQPPVKMKKGSVAEKKVQQIQKQQAMAPQQSDTPAAGGGKIAGMLKGLNGGRISQLLGKVSAQSARSANVVVTNGIQAGSAPSGQALSAIGNIEKSGRDWSADASGKAVSVSTAGKGGGRNVAGMGSLSGGHVGQSGVGLIEDESEISGGLDREVIAQYIKTQLGQILYCYERQLSANPDLFGKVAVRFTIGSQGQVESQNIGDTTLKNATVEGCILNRVAAWKFPAPQGGTRVNVTYPFLFKSTN